MVVCFASTGRSFGIPHHGHGPPTWVVGPLAHSAATMTAPRFILLLAAMWLFYLLVLASWTDVSRRWAIGSVLALTTIFTIGPVLLSTDVFNYMDYGRLGAIHHVSPYLHGPVAARHDPVFPFVNWRHTPSIYGPLFTLGTYAIAPLGPAGMLWSLKVMMGLASLGCVALVWLCADRLGRSPVFAALFLGLNPMLIVFGVGGAHNDVLALLLLMAALTFVIANRDAFGGSALVAAVAVKATAVPLLPFLYLGSRKRWMLLAGIAGASALVLVVGLSVFGTAVVEPFKVVMQHEHLYYPQSVPPHVAYLLGINPQSSAVRIVAELAAILVVGALVVRTALRGGWITNAGFAELALLVGTTWLLAWYTIWILPFAALTRDRRLQYAALALGTFIVVAHLYYLNL